MHALWTRPWVLALVAGLAVVVIAFVPSLWLLWSRGGDAPVAPVGDALPWRIDLVDRDTTRVFGLTLGRSPLADALPRDAEPQVALVGRGDEVGALEALVDPFVAGFVGGRLVVVADADPALRRAWRERSTRRDAGGDGGWRHRLAADDLAQAMRSPVAGLTFIPSAQLDAATLRLRFGEPDERVRTGERLEHWLYPARGLAITLDAEGREVLQYVAPSQFEARLRAPLQNAAR